MSRLGPEAPTQDSTLPMHLASRRVDAAKDTASCWACTFRSAGGGHGVYISLSRWLEQRADGICVRNGLPGIVGEHNLEYQIEGTATAARLNVIPPVPRHRTRIQHAESYQKSLCWVFDPGGSAHTHDVVIIMSNAYPRHEFSQLRNHWGQKDHFASEKTVSRIFETIYTQLIGHSLLQTR